MEQSLFCVLVCQNAARLAQRGTLQVATFRRLAIFYQIIKISVNIIDFRCCLYLTRGWVWSLCRLRRSCGFDERGSGWLLSDGYVARKSGLGFGIGIFGNEFHVRFSRRFGLQEYIQKSPLVSSCFRATTSILSFYHPPSLSSSTLAVQDKDNGPARLRCHHR